MDVAQRREVIRADFAYALRSADGRPSPSASRVIIGGLLTACAFEFVGAFEENGWQVAAALTPVAYVAWSLWLIAVGVALLM